MDQSDCSISRAALGRVAKLGAIYDCRNDNFDGTANIFTKDMPKSCHEPMDNPNFNAEYVNDDNFSEKFFHLGVSAELQVSLLGGVLSLQGSGKYISKEKKSSKLVKISLIYKSTLKQENFNIYDEELTDDYFSSKAILATTGTHIVTGITWGANSVVSFTHNLEENENNEEIEGIFGVTLKKATSSINGKGQANFDEKDVQIVKKFRLEFSGDVIPVVDTLPQTIEGVLNFFNSVPDLAKSYNEGKGKQVNYILTPIHILATRLNMKVSPDKIFNTSNEESLKKIVDYFEIIAKTKQKLCDQNELMSKYEFCITRAHIDEMQNLKKDFGLFEAKFRENVGKSMIELRGGEEKAIPIENLYSEYLQHKMSPKNTQRNISEIEKSISKKIEFANLIKQKNIIYIGDKTSSLEIEKNLNIGVSKMYILYFLSSRDETNQRELEPHKILFFTEFLNKDNQENKENKVKKFYVVDCEVQELSNETNRIEIVEKGNIICQNYLEKMLEMGPLPIAKYFEDNFEKIIEKRKETTCVEIRCPREDCDQKVAHKWICSKCRKGLEYGYDKYFYCYCGRGNMYNYEYKCPNTAHQNIFNKFEDKRFFTALIKNLTPLEKELNILLLGETGVGKSTWINAFLNYVTFEKLKDAEKDPLCYQIPSKFVVNNSDGEPVEVGTGGENEHEFSEIGASATRKTVVYVFQVGTFVVRLIDTPGIGDTRSGTTDQENFQNILNTLSIFKDVHSICIFLKPEETRLTDWFKYCINGLLNYLHRDSADNIIFCFTYSRPIYYEGGSSYRILKKYFEENACNITMKKNTAFYFDSEAFKYLVGLKKLVKFKKHHKKDCEQSWDQSRSETKRLLEQISKLKPHEINSTVSLYTARNLIYKLSGPIVEISVNIHKNMNSIEDQQEKLNKNEENVKDLKKNLYIRKLDYETIKIDHPRTVCSSSDCVEILVAGQVIKDYKDLGNSLVTSDCVPKTNYKTHCHAKCHLTGIVAGNRGAQGLSECSAMDSVGICTHCKHSWQVHLHIWYETKETYVDIIDKSIENLIQQNISAKEKIKAICAIYNERLNEYNQELDQILETSAKFAHFLKCNAILGVREDVTNLFDFQNYNETNKTKYSGTPILIQKLEVMMNKCQDKFKKVYEKYESGENHANILTSEEMIKLAQDLYKMHHFGRYVESCIVAIDEHKNDTLFYIEMKPDNESYEKAVIKMKKKIKKSGDSFFFE